jgi:uncharacterized protein (DUF1800 family)
MSAPDEASIACNRFGLGPRPGELATVTDSRRWLRDQLTGGAPLLDTGPDGERLRSSRDILAGAEPILAQLRQLRSRTPPGGAPDAVAAAATTSASVTTAASATAARIPQYFRPFYQADVRSRLHAAATTSRPFVERLVYFWSNHFAVSVDKMAVLGVAGAMEREAIRPHVLGRFDDMLLAVEKHPAMLLYLDNELSIGPDSTAARLVRRPVGLNENLAREILELHTLGVDGGYTQADVTAFARVLTGWSLSGGAGPSDKGPLAGAAAVRRGGGGEFMFRPALHEPGTAHVVGRDYAQQGVAQGEAVLHDLARSSATARHIATKLVRHFVADEPPPAAVARVAQAFERTGGDLPTVYSALIDLPAAWTTPFSKFRTPQDYVFSLHRALSLSDAEGAAHGTAAFDVLGQRQFSPGSPAGWPDRSADWDGAAALMKRIELADAVARKLGDRVDAATLAPQLWGTALSGATREAVARADSAAQALTLLLTAPEFMRR